MRSPEGASLTRRASNPANGVALGLRALRARPIETLRG
jgi:hypothetical protein